MEKTIFFKGQDCWEDWQPHPSLPRPLLGHHFSMDLSWTPDLFGGILPVDSHCCRLFTCILPLFPSNLFHTTFHLAVPLTKILLATISLVLENSSYIAWMFWNVMPSLFCLVFPLLFYQLLPGWSHPFFFLLLFFFNIQQVAENPRFLSPAQISVMSCKCATLASWCLKCTTNVPWRHKLPDLPSRAALSLGSSNQPMDLMFS